MKVLKYENILNILLLYLLIKPCQQTTTFITKLVITILKDNYDFFKLLTFNQKLNVITGVTCKLEQ